MKNNEPKVLKEITILSIVCSLETGTKVNQEKSALRSLG